MNKKIYIEAGANDGIFQSRSINLESNNLYLGIMIEPIISVFRSCIKNRPNCLHYNCALVDFNYPNQDIEINLHNLHSAMATITKAIDQQYVGTMRVPARTLDSILEENNITNIEYFFLDVEGYELNVLKGINFDKRHFNYIEIECHYTLLGIKKEDEIESHVNFLKLYNYVLTDTIENQGNIKLIFNHHENL